MSLRTLSSQMLPAIEAELKKQVARLDTQNTKLYYEMLTYHMGWSGEGAGPEASGKRIRPLMVLLCAAANSEEAYQQNSWEKALPAAAAVELVHNFSLVHDDIQDNSDKRRGRPTLWTKWGMPQAINAGDGLFVLSNLAINDLTEAYPAEARLRAAKVLHETCLSLTRGQFLDISYEDRVDLAESDYWPMISGKTAALLAGCCQIGAILGGADPEQEQAYHDFGMALGLAFQVQDDILGIWGDETITGKSAASDLLEGKKSLPVLFGLGKQREFSRRWLSGPITADQVEGMAQLLASEGASGYAQEKSAALTQQAIDNLAKSQAKGQAGQALAELADRLLGRDS